MFKVKYIFLVSFILVLLTATNGVCEYRVAIVDLNRVVNSTKDAKIKQEELEKLSNKAKQDYEARAKKVKALEDEFTKTNDKNKRIELEKATRDLKIFVADSKENLQKKFKDTNSKLISDIVDIIKKYAKENNIDLVLDKNSFVLGVVVYNENAIDITEELIRKVR